MATRTELSSGEFYHIYNRGTEKRDIFQSQSDYDRFLSLLYIGNSDISVDLKLQGSTLYDFLILPRNETLVDICAYVLMPNHFHLLVRGKEEGGISKFMQKITTGYTMFFNKKYERSGALFQGKFKAKHIDKDEYLKYLISYIHLNPIKLIEPMWKEMGIQNKTQAEQYLAQYANSSYLDYAGIFRKNRSILNEEALPEYFESPNDFTSHVQYWLQGRTL
jgi:putative transposase